MHYNRKEKNKVSTPGRKKESFNNMERERRFGTRERESDGHEERERLLTEGRKHVRPWGRPTIEKGERESNGQGESVSIEGKDRRLINTNLQRMRPRSSN
jgi:hypothetical protein